MLLSWSWWAGCLVPSRGLLAAFLGLGRGCCVRGWAGVGAGGYGVHHGSPRQRAPRLIDIEPLHDRPCDANVRVRCHETHVGSSMETKPISKALEILQTLHHAIERERVFELGIEDPDGLRAVIQEA